MMKKIAFICYESPFAPGGGIAAVIGKLPQSVEQSSGLLTLVVTPYHQNISKTTSLKDSMARVGRVSVPYDGDQAPVNIFSLERNGSWVFLQPQQKAFFAGKRHPYDVGETQEKTSAILLRDALFFGAASVRALGLIDPQAEWILLMQDWEAATCALALSDGEIGPEYITFLTLHNSYDSPAPPSELARFGIDPLNCPGDTILTRALPLVEKPVFTVSDQFSRDFNSEILQAEVMAPHLQDRLSGVLVGVNNGLFADLAIPDEALSSARLGDFSRLKAWKSGNRDHALKALSELTATKDTPVWGNPAKFGQDDAPWFVLAGRDDARQKGYDIACAAIERFLSQGGQARFLFFPIPGDEGLAGLSFLRKLAERFPESVLVLPFIFREGYFSALQGATYGIMPSLYEPFGMANEFYLNGTVGIGRATGGILQQIVPLRSARAFSHAVQVRSDQWYGASAHPTGILYRELDGIPSAASDWEKINDAGYELGGKSPDRVQERSAYPLFQAMVDELRASIEDGVQVFTEQPDLYYRLLTEGIDYIQNSFSWRRAASAYVRYLR